MIDAKTLIRTIGDSTASNALRQVAVRALLTCDSADALEALTHAAHDIELPPEVSDSVGRALAMLLWREGRLNADLALEDFNGEVYLAFDSEVADLQALGRNA